jgi:hypothetical protein
MDKNPVIRVMRTGRRENLPVSWMRPFQTMAGSFSMNLGEYTSVVGNTSSHWANLDIPSCEPTFDPWLSPASKDDLIQRLTQMLFIVRQDFETLQKSDPVHVPESLALDPLDTQRIQVRITKRKTPKFTFIEE